MKLRGGQWRGDETAHRPHELFKASKAAKLHLNAEAVLPLPKGIVANLGKRDRGVAQDKQLSLSR